MLTKIPLPTTPRGDRPSLVEHVRQIDVPVLGDLVLQKFNGAEKSLVQQTYAKLFNFWVNGPQFRRESAVGRNVLDKVWRCTHDPYLLIVLIDDLDKFNELLSSVDLESNEHLRTLHRYLRFSFVCGAEKIGERLMATLDYYPTDPNHDDNYEYQNTLARIGSSGNMEWIKTIIHRNGQEQIPDPAYKFATTDIYENLNALSDDLGFDRIDLFAPRL